MKKNSNYIQAFLGILGSVLVYVLGILVNAGIVDLFGITYTNKFLSFGVFVLFVVYALGIAVFGKKKDKPVFYKAAIITLSIPLIFLFVVYILSLTYTFIRDVFPNSRFLWLFIAMLCDFLQIMGVGAQFVAIGFVNEILYYIALWIFMPLSIVASGVIYKKMK